MLLMFSVCGSNTREDTLAVSIPSVFLVLRLLCWLLVDIPSPLHTCKPKSSSESSDDSGYPQCGIEKLHFCRGDTYRITGKENLHQGYRPLPAPTEWQASQPGSIPAAPEARRRDRRDQWRGPPGQRRERCRRHPHRWPQQRLHQWYQRSD
jgi:hypothetical protein